jgi:hypothetical protein
MASYMALIICNYKTNNDNSFYRGSASDISGRESNRLDEALSAVEMMAALVVMVAQAALAVMAALAALAASKMAAIRLSVQWVVAGGEGGMLAWLAGQAVLPARGAAMQVQYSANLAFLAGWLLQRAWVFHRARSFTSNYACPRGGVWRVVGAGMGQLNPSRRSHSPATPQMGEARWQGARWGDRTTSCNPPPAPARGGR